MKKKLAVGAVALSMVLAGTGYAYWTDSLNITTNATSGNMDVKFMDLGLLAQYNDGKYGWSIIDGIGNDGAVGADYFSRDKKDYNIIAAEGTIDKYYARADGYNDVSFDAKLVEPGKLDVTIGEYQTSASVNVSDKIEVNLENIYPGYAQAFRTDVGNVGNIAAKLSNIVVSSSGQDTGNLEDMIGVAFLAFRECNEEKNGKVVGLAEQFDKKDIFTMGGVDFVRLSSLKKADLSKAEYFNNTLFVVPSKNRIDFDWAVAMDPDAEGNYTTGSTKVNNTRNDDKASMGRSIMVSMDFMWDQFNEGMEEKTVEANLLKLQNKK